MQKIAFLDRKTVPVPLRKPNFPHRWQEYDQTPPADVVTRLRDATMAITNKVPLREAELKQLPKLRLIAVAATGYDCVDVAACRTRGITVCNVPNYTGHSVPEHVFMLILALRRNLLAYHEVVRSGRWQKSPIFTILDYPIRDLYGSTLGIIGYGKLGQAVEQLAKAFGITVLIAEHKGAAAVRPGRTLFNEVLEKSDILSLHCPRTTQTQNLIGPVELTRMKRNALLINTARGGLVDEAALAQALKSGQIGGAGIDVLSQEPPKKGSPLLDLKLSNLIVTPHVAWTSQQALSTLSEEVIANLEAFVGGTPRNVVS